MRSLAIFALVAAALLSSAPSMAQTPGSQNERTYGMERATRAFLSVIEQVNEMTLVELRAPTMF